MDDRRPSTPGEALERLTAGNARFAGGKLEAGHRIVGRRAEVAAKQMPWAILLTCADSRVSPEHVFDQSLGDLFVCRVAGNVLDDHVVGSIEYAVEHFCPPLLMVLGHQRCGAVTDTIALVEKRGTAPGSIQSIVEAIAPVVRSTERGSLDAAAYVDAVVGANAGAVAKSIEERSAIVSDAVSAGQLGVQPAVYSLDSGRVELLR
jgi:carbonic anhydrase